MGIDPKIEQPTRKMLGYAIRHELDDLAALIITEGNEAYLSATALCMIASAYIAIDVSGMRWPSEVVLRAIANNAAKSATGLDVSEGDIFEFLSRVALGSERIDLVFSPEQVATVPLYTTANLLLSFCPRDKDWWEYLDEIWDATETADHTSLSVLPSLMLRARKERTPPSSSADR
jgi:hypothetical protein